MEHLSLDLELSALQTNQGWRKPVGCCDMARGGTQEQGVQMVRTQVWWGQGCGSRGHRGRLLVESSGRLQSGQAQETNAHPLVRADLMSAGPITCCSPFCVTMSPLCRAEALGPFPKQPQGFYRRPVLCYSRSPLLLPARQCGGRIAATEFVVWQSLR